MGGVTEVTDATFDDDVLGAGRPVVVDFWAPWCRPCSAIAPIMEDMAEDYGDRVGFAKLNIDESPAAGARYRVLSIPTVIVFEGGEPRSTVVGARSRTHYEQAWADWLVTTS
jgi:thioredoxin 1